MFENAEIVSSYTADEAIDDGILVDVSEMAREAGFVWPVRITQSVHELCTPPASNKIQSYDGRLWDVIFLLKMASKRTPKTERMVVFTVKIGKTNQTLWAVIDETSGPAIHIMLPEDY